jgi:hypothetical protein
MVGKPIGGREGARKNKEMQSEREVRFEQCTAVSFKCHLSLTMY